jgi:PKD repeat protein
VREPDIPLILVEAQITSGEAEPGEDWFFVTEGLGGPWSFDWDTGADVNGKYTVHVRSSKDGGVIEQVQHTFTVANDRPPVLDAIGDKIIDENALLAFTVTASDPDGDVVTLSAAVLPAGATFTPGTGAFSWTPTFDQAGDYAVTFTATDSDGQLDSEAITITVNNVDRPAAVLLDPGMIDDEYSVLRGSTLSFEATAVDPDAEHDATLDHSVPLPDGAGFVFADTTHGTFSWTPVFGQGGIHTVTFTATSAGGSVDRIVTIEVIEWDQDNDGVADTTDNCLSTPNPSQANLDGDASGDACDSDIDGDGVDNADDRYPYDRRRW